MEEKDSISLFINVSDNLHYWLKLSSSPSQSTRTHSVLENLHIACQMSLRKWVKELRNLLWNSNSTCYSPCDFALVTKSIKISLSLSLKRDTSNYLSGLYMMRSCMCSILVYSKYLIEVATAIFVCINDNESTTEASSSH